MVFTLYHLDIQPRYGVYAVSLNFVYGLKVITGEQAHRQTMSKPFNPSGFIST
jgi:hypothetical protein